MNEIKMNPVKSSQIKSVGYDSDNWILYLEFINGIVYEYYRVPIIAYESLLLPTMSVGKYFYLEIKGKYEYKKTDYTVLFNKLHKENIEE